MVIMLEHNSNKSVVRKLKLGGTMICFNVLKAGDIDLCPEYIGTDLLNIMKRNVISYPNKAYDSVLQAFLEEHGLLWLKLFGFNNTYTLTMRQLHIESGIVTISDLAKYTDTHRSKK